MLPGIKNDLMYLLNILESIEKVIQYSKDCSDAEAFYEHNDQLFCIPNGTEGLCPVKLSKFKSTNYGKYQSPLGGKGRPPKKIFEGLFLPEHFFGRKKSLPNYGRLA